MAHAVARQVDDLFLAVPLDLDARHRRWLLDVARAAQGWGLGLHALGGDPAWCDDPTTAAGWQRNALEVGIFAHTHIDVEFWTHPRWESDPRGLADSYLDLVEVMSEEASLECDLPWWLHQHQDGTGERLDAAVMRRAAGVTVLTYRRSVRGEGGLLDVAGAALKAGTTVGTPVRLAVDTSRPEPGQEHTTFYGGTARDVDRALAEVDRHLRESASYAGIAVHDLAGWRALRA